MNKSQMIGKVKSFINDEYGTSKEYARARGVTPQFISAVLRGIKEPPQWMLSDVGLAKNINRVVTYEDGDK